jgi:hypothetical protein
MQTRRTSSTIAKNGLYDLLANQHNTDECPNTYIRGTKRIDYIFGTEKVRKHCKSSGILPFCYGYPSDHRAIYVRVDINSILQTEIHAIESIASRMIQSATPKERVKFLHELNSHYIAQNLYERLTKLWSKLADEWTQEEETEFNKCDWQHIQGMLAAEKKTCKVKTHAWSPKYSNAVERKNYWKIILTLKRHHTKPDNKKLAWAEALGVENVELLNTTQINLHLRQAQQNLREVQKEATQLREDHL